MVSERFLLPIVLKPILNNKEAKASEVDRPRMSEDTISCVYTHLINIVTFQHEKRETPIPLLKPSIGMKS
jgi:hypothetical protein